MSPQLRQLKAKRNKLEILHENSFQAHGFCTLEGCRCYQRKAFSYHRIRKIVAASIEMTPQEIEECNKYWQKIERIKKRRAKE